MKLSIVSLKQQLVSILSENIDLEMSGEVADYFVWAEASDNRTQGILKMTGPEPIHRIKAKAPLEVVRDTPLSQLIDAHANPAPVAVLSATDAAIDKAKRSGFSIVGVRNTFSSNGAQAYYAEKIAEHDLIGIVVSRSPAAVCGFGSVEAIFGTNPIGFGFPADTSPLVFDTATSAMTFYGLVLAKTQGRDIPDNMAIDHDGNLTTDPEAAIDGAILPFDRSHRGSGFGMVVETLAGPLLGGAWIDNKTLQEEWGTTIIAISPELLVDTEDFKANIKDMVSKIRSSRTKDGELIRLPGDESRKKLEQAMQTGEVEIDDAVARELGIVE